MRDKPALTIIIPAYNSSKTIGSCLSSLLQQKFENDFEVIVVDDHSTDDTRKIVKDFNVCLIKLKEHTGRIGLVRNIGVLNAKADNLVFIDSDCIAAKNFLTEIHDHLKEHDCIMGYLKNVATSWLALPWARIVKFHFSLTVKRGVVKSLSVPWAIKRTLFLKTGGFNMYFRGGEDKEYGIRLRKRGVVIRHVPTAIICHIHFLTLRSYFLKKFYRGVAYAFRHKTNFLETLAKILKNLIKIIPKILLKRKVEAIKSLLSIVGNSGFLFGQLQASLSSLNAQEYTLGKLKKST